MKLFDDHEGWEARLRQQKLVTRRAMGRGEEIMVTNPVAVVEAKFHLGQLDRLADPRFLGVERRTEEGSTYLVYEALAPRPTHFQELGMNTSIPTIIRHEMLETIDHSWGKSDESWIDIIAIPTSYRMDAVDGELTFAKTRLSPLVGAKVHLLSSEAVDSFLSIKDGAELGKVVGFEIPIKVDMQNLVRYHTGIFGFTGVGKSNLMALLLRKALASQADLRVIIFDIAGEYFTHLADEISVRGEIYSTEPFTTADQFLNSQIIPETLEGKLGGIKPLHSVVEKLMGDGRIKLLDFEAESAFNLEYLLSMLEGVGSKAGAVQAKVTSEKVRNLITTRRLKRDTNLKDLKEKDLAEISSMLRTASETAPQSSGLRSDLISLLSYLETSSPDEKSRPITTQSLAHTILEEREGSITVVYCPEPKDARFILSSLIERILYLKKTAGMGFKKVLIIIDEAQEFIPDRTRREDYTDWSNIAVEALLRQGRKYRTHCWLGTQRVAHLNVSALQQLHSYFVNILPRIYDRITVADAFAISYDMLDKTLDLDIGQWLFVSYKASKQKNVPVFIEAPDNEEIVVDRLKSIK